MHNITSIKEGDMGKQSFRFNYTFRMRQNVLRGHNIAIVFIFVGFLRLNFVRRQEKEKHPVD